MVITATVLLSGETAASATNTLGKVQLDDLLPAGAVVTLYTVTEPL